jgi:hypothetical protein
MDQLYPRALGSLIRSCPLFFYMLFVVLYGRYTYYFTLYSEQKLRVWMKNASETASIDPAVSAIS